MLANDLSEVRRTYAECIAALAESDRGRPRFNAPLPNGTRPGQDLPATGHLAWLLVCRTENLDEASQQLLVHVRRQPLIAKAYDLAQTLPPCSATGSRNNSRLGSFARSPRPCRTCASSRRGCANDESSANLIILLSLLHSAGRDRQHQ
jgi:hypothetical protein